MTGKIMLTLTAGSLLALGAATTNAASVTLDFEGLTSGVLVGDFYNGDPAPGTDYGISFTDALAAVNNPNVANNPSGDSVIYSAQTQFLINIAGGFQDIFSFWYSSPNGGATVRLWSDLGGVGTELETIILPATPSLPQQPLLSNWQFVEQAFGGTAQSVTLFGIPGTGYDDITFGEADDNGGNGGNGNIVPTPAALGPGLAMLGTVLGFRRRRR